MVRQPELVAIELGQLKVRRARRTRSAPATSSHNCRNKQGKQHNGPTAQGIRVQGYLALVGTLQHGHSMLELTNCFYCSHWSHSIFEVWRGQMRTIVSSTAFRERDSHYQLRR